jgi:hypothetical protein
MIDFAFPLVYDDIPNNERVVYKGMLLRDYFAAKAMQSMNSRPDYEDVPAGAIALDAYALADAMMKARAE